MARRRAPSACDQARISSRVRKQPSQWLRSGVMRQTDTQGEGIGPVKIQIKLARNAYLMGASSYQF